MANTLTFAEGQRPLAEGTDGRGILGWLDDQGLRGAPFGVLGFGATARSLVHAAWNLGCPPVCVVTRRPTPVRRQLTVWAEERGRDRLRGNGPAAVGIGAFEGLAGGGVAGEIRVWISTWPPGAVPAGAFWRTIFRRSVILDLNYGEGRSTVADAARREGFRASDGLGPLLQQAARSLSIWLDEPVEPDLFRRAAGVPAANLRPCR